MHVPIQIVTQADIKAILLGAFFFGFFALAAVAVRYADRRWIRQGYLAYFFAFLLLVNLTGMPLFPFVSWYKFSEPLPETITRYEIRVADTEGDELLYDARATPPMNGPHFWKVGERMTTAYDRRTTCRSGRFFLQRARGYRDHIQQQSLAVFEWVDFPRHVLDREWTGGELASHARFSALRVYRVNVETAPSGRSVESYHERHVLTFREDGKVIRFEDRNHSSIDTAANGSARSVSICAGTMTPESPETTVSNLPTAPGTAHP